MREVFLATFLCCFCIQIFAQAPLENRFNLYQKTKSQGKLYVHYDKNVYAGNETIWFTAYLLNTLDISRHKLLSVSLIRESDDRVVQENRFEMKDGMAFGSIILPDSVPVGNYRLQAITDYVINEEPEAIFTQYITVKSGASPAFRTKLNVLDVQGNRQRIAVYAATAENEFFKKPLEVTYTYGDERKTIKSDNSGRAVIELDYLPNLNDPILYVKAVNDNDSTFVSMPVKERVATPNVGFYPEGGTIVAGLVNRIGWEIKDNNKQPIKATAYLYKNDERISTVQSNELGMGSFEFLAEDAVFTLKVVDNEGVKDGVFVLPEIKSQGIVFSVAEGVVTDRVRCVIRAKEEQEVHLRIHDFRNIFASAKISLKPEQRNISIPLNGVPKGLVTITITDAADRPLVERLIFAHYDRDPKLSIASDKQEYRSREKVTLKLAPQGAVDKSIVSVAVVEDARIEPGKMTDIESYAYLKSELAAVPISEKGDVYREKKYLEDVLLIKGWRQYNWEDFTKTTAQDTNMVYSNLKYMGIIERGRKSVDRPMELGIVSGKEWIMMATDPKGAFDINRPEMYAEAGKKLHLFVSTDKTNRSFRLAIDNQLLTAGQKLAKAVSVDVKPPVHGQADNSHAFVGIGKENIRIEEVLVSRAVARGAAGPNACGDYVCPYNILNCVNHYGHSGNRAPVAGQEYKYHGGPVGEKMIYPGCTASDQDSGFFMRLEGINRNKVYYADSYSDPKEPAFYSTIYWNHAVVLDKGKETALEFYTGDIEGKFRIVVQGIGLGKNDVVFGEQFFEVQGDK